QGRGADPRARRPLHHRDRHPQHAAGGAGLRLHRLLLPRRARRVRRHERPFYEPQRFPNRRLHHRAIWMKKHTDREYEGELEQLPEPLLLMGAKVEEMIKSSIRALTARDSVLAQRMIEFDHQINRLEVETDELCLRILAKRQPVASDLRFITMALKLVTD